MYLQAKRDGAAAKRFFRQLLRGHGGEPRKTVTDKLRSYGVAHRELLPENREWDYPGLDELNCQYPDQCAAGNGHFLTAW